MAMIDLNRVLNQSLSSVRSNRGPGRISSQGWKLQFAVRIRYAAGNRAAGVSEHRSKAQELTATLSGIVSDSTGAVIPNANITITLNGVGGSIAILPRSTGRNCSPSATDTAQRNLYRFP